MTRVRDGGSVPVEVELLNAVVAVGHDHGGSGCRAASWTVQPTPKHRPIRVELNVDSLVRRIRPEHGRIISAPNEGQAHVPLRGYHAETNFIQIAIRFCCIVSGL